MTRLIHLALAIAAMTLPACSGADDPSLIRAGALPTRLVSNALSYNALDLHALAPLSLAGTALAADTLGEATRDALTDPGPGGQLARQLVRYAVGCAFTADQSFQISWNDAAGARHDETYAGQLGLEPSWSVRPLSPSGQAWVSACLAARANWYGIPVLISARGSARSLAHVAASERASYAREEGAFWGNLFQPTPVLYACYDDAHRAYARALHRDCAAGHEGPSGAIEECGIIRIVGSCSERCAPPTHDDQYHPSCGAEDARQTSAVVTVLLPS